MITRIAQSIAALSAFTLLGTTAANAQEMVAYQITANQAGNQSAGASLGLDFVATDTVTVTRLGCFDDNGDGLVNSITVELWLRGDNETPEDPADDVGDSIVTTLSFDSAEPGVLEGGFRFKDLPSAIDLAAGSYTIVAYGFTADDQNYNAGFAPGVAPLSTDDGDGLLQFGGTGRYGGAGNFPGTPDGGPANRYAAGTFAFRFPDTDGDGMPDFWETLYGLISMTPVTQLSTLIPTASTT